VVARRQHLRNEKKVTGCLRHFTVLPCLMRGREGGRKGGRGREGGRERASEGAREEGEKKRGRGRDGGRTYTHTKKHSPKSA
jgi:hypothetical protein